MPGAAGSLLESPVNLGDGIAAPSFRFGSPAFRLDSPLLLEEDLNPAVPRVELNPALISTPQTYSFSSRHGKSSVSLVCVFFCGFDSPDVTVISEARCSPGFPLQDLPRPSR